MTFWLPWTIDALVALIAVGFFLVGLGDGSVSSFNIGLWLGTLGGLAIVVGGSLWLRAEGRGHLAASLVWLLAVPALLVGAFFAAVIVLQPRWN